ncbi:MAG: hypothetical protein HUK22_01660, partial [Thermoguttaceae bacterium]|nr:hypothetical protein [Thermoguttaceae bacterium]
QAAEAADPKKPIFVLQHYHVTPTVYGSRGEDNWGIDDLFETFQKHPRVVDFSGHSHYPINDPRSVWQGRFSAFGTGTLSYFEMGAEGGKYNKFPAGYNQAAQFYVVEVRKDNSVVLKPYDLITDSFFDVVYYVPQPGAVETYAYTDERYKTSEKPVWNADAAPTVSDIDSNGATLTFPQAACKDVVHSYRVEIERKTGKGVWEAFGAEYFWSEYYFRNVPKTMRCELGTLEGSGEYRAKIIALNPFFKESEKTLVAEFATPPDPMETVDKNAPAPDANVLDVQFDGDKVVNVPKNGLKTQKSIEIIGAPKIGGAAAAFDGEDDFLKVKFESRDYARLRRGSFAVRFKFDAFPKSASDVFANTEGRGVAMELNPKTKELEFWASVNGKYQKISAPVKPGEWIDAFGTFDGEAVVLYINGKEAARTKAPGALTHPTDSVVQAFCIGCDIAPGGVGSYFFKGEVARA